MWSDRALETDRRLIAAIRETNLKEVITQRGQGSIAFFIRWARGARKISDLTRLELERLSRHIAAEKLPKLRIAIDSNIPPPEAEFYKMHRIRQLYKPLGSISSKEFRDNRNPRSLITSFKIGLNLTELECQTWCLRLRKLTSTTHKALILKVAHGDIYTQDKLF